MAAHEQELHFELEDALTQVKNLEDECHVL
jgi:hypothetical protein